MNNRFVRSLLRVVMAGLVAGFTYPLSAEEFAGLDNGQLRVLKDSLHFSGMSAVQKADHALNRLSYGQNPRSALLVETLASAPDSDSKIIDFVVSSMRVGARRNPEVQSIVARHFPHAGMTYPQIVIESKRRDGEPLADYISRRNALKQGVIKAARAQQFMHSTLNKYPLGEILTDFWFNHFNVVGKKTYVQLLDYADVAIRERIYGTFEGMLMGVAKHPGMLIYLDNFSSVRPHTVVVTRNGRQVVVSRGPNENYARELMELHTLGSGPRSGLYAQADVVEATKVLTGWGIATDWESGVQEFSFNPGMHVLGPKQVMGHTYDSGEGPEAIREGQSLIHFLANHPLTRRNICRKLAVRLLADYPPASLIDECASPEVWGNGGDLKAIYATIISSPYFWSEHAYRSKMKRPLELVVSAHRAAGMTSEHLDSKDAITEGIEGVVNLGQNFFSFTFPTGFPDRNRDWANAGYIANVARFMFRATNLNVKVGGREGLELEQFVTDLADGGSAQNRARALNFSLERALKLDYLMFSPMAIAGLTTVFDKPDVLVQGHAHAPLPMPLRTIATMVFGSKEFMLR